MSNHRKRPEIMTRRIYNVILLSHLAWSILFLLLELIQPSCHAFYNNYLLYRHHRHDHACYKRKVYFYRYLSLRDQDYCTGVGLHANKKGSYSLGLRPFLVVKNNNSDVTSSSGKENRTVDNLLPPDIVQAPLDDVKENCLPQEFPEVTNSINIVMGGTTATSSSINGGEEVQEEIVSFNITDNKDQEEVNPMIDPPSLLDSKIAKDSKAEKSKNVLAETISQSFLFFDDRPKRRGDRSNKKSGGNPADYRSNSYRPFKNVKSDHLLSSSNDTKGTLDPSKTLTLEDLQNILQQSGYIRRDEVNTILSTGSPEAIQYNVTAKVKKSKSGVAFPQPTTLSNKHIKIGSMISSGFFGLLLATTIRPNLWLMGGVVGTLYGGDLAEKAAEQSNAMSVTTIDGIVVPAPTRPIPGGLYGELTLKCGKKIATAYLQVWDLFQGIWFMYRTGQLSYEYYRTYAALDKRFGIQNKMDAWNARFIEGKENFDRWEKENEVGRKVLAGLRTAWMVEESSYKKQRYLKKGKKRSKYRLIQVVIDVTDWFKRLFRALWGAVRGGDNKELNEIVKGVRVGFQELNLEVASQRAGSAIAALVAVNLIGALFAVAPYLLGVTAIISGAIWPNWMGNTAKVIKEVINETRARGRGEQVVREQKQNREKLPFVDKKSFHFYIGKDGKKKWYRTGQSYKKVNNGQKSNGKDFFSIRLPWVSDDYDKR